ncbi:divergent polysaccharide deacetylase family protein [Phascolarctobacterium sp.]|uniref:divergent polysaccharide deacetylase family protein n=1 Tax=Phascolarctobacterium sp. TaxID=2049039 RepID=UPI0038683C33
MATRRRRKKSSGSKYAVLVLIAIITLLAVACGMFYANGRSKKDVGDTKGSTPKEVSLLDESIEAQRLVDTILLQKDNWQLIENDHGKKSVEVEESGAKVQINQRNLAVGVPNSTSLTGAGAWLQEKVEKAGLEYISGEMGKYKKWDAFIAKVGVKVKAGDGSKEFVTDTITFFHNGNLKKADKDVKDLPEEPVAEPEVRQYKGKIAIVIDDCGADMASVRTLLNTGLPFSYAILPDKAFSSDVLEMVKSKGRVPMLHLPMEPLSKSAMSEGSRTVLVSQSAAQKQAMVRKALQGLPGVVGVNNHQGSRATADKATMKAVLQVLKNEGMFFVDSRTNSASVARDMAKDMGVNTARNDIFLDNSTNVEEIRRQIYKAFAMAEKNGSAIAICHARTNTAKCWQQYAAEFKKTGITFVPVTDLLY